MFSEGLSVPSPLFSVGVNQSEAGAVVAVEGELDLATAPQLRDTLVALSEQGQTQIVLDLTRLQFIDSTGLSVLVMAHNRARADSGSILIRNPSQSVLRIFEITGLVSVFTIEDKDAVPSAGA
jgi:anti-sigma B factor antagonist